MEETTNEIEQTDEKQKHKFGISFNSPVILSFCTICLLVLILGQLTKGASTMKFFCVYRSSFTDFSTYIRLFAHVFGHAGWSHFFNNITMILVVGPLLEEKYGSKSMIIVILLTAVVTGLIHMLIFPNTALLGASGVVFAFILLSSLTSIKSGRIPLTFILVAVIYIGGQVYDGVMLEDNVSNLTHILGGVVGASFGYGINLKKMRENLK